MKPKDKALELYEKLRAENTILTANVRAKKQALICVEYLIKENLDFDTGNITDALTIEKLNKRYNYWKEVKSELEKL